LQICGGMSALRITVNITYIHTLLRQHTLAIGLSLLRHYYYINNNRNKNY
jgi:hypothetical protein